MRADAVGQQDLAQAVVVAAGRGAFDVVHALGEIVDAERHGGDQQRPDIAERLGEVERRIGQMQAELAERAGDLGRLHQHVEVEKPSEPGEHGAERHRGKAARQAERQPHPGRPADQHDRRATA